MFPGQLRYINPPANSVSRGLVPAGHTQSDYKERCLGGILISLSHLKWPLWDVKEQPLSPSEALALPLIIFVCVTTFRSDQTVAVYQICRVFTGDEQFALNMLKMLLLLLYDTTQKGTFQLSKVV